MSAVLEESAAAARRGSARRGGAGGGAGARRRALLRRRPRRRWPRRARRWGRRCEPRSTGAPSRCVRLSAGEIAALGLDASQKYLLSRCDGRRALGTDRPGGAARRAGGAEGLPRLRRPGRGRAARGLTAPGYGLRARGPRGRRRRPRAVPPPSRPRPRRRRAPPQGAFTRQLRSFTTTTAKATLRIVGRREAHEPGVVAEGVGLGERAGLAGHGEPLHRRLAGARRAEGAAPGALGDGGPHHGGELRGHPLVEDAARPGRGGAARRPTTRPPRRAARRPRRWRRWRPPWRRGAARGAPGRSRRRWWRARRAPRGSRRARSRPAARRGWAG